MTIIETPEAVKNTDEGPQISQTDMVFYTIENYFSELINFQLGSPDVSIQFKEAIEFFQRNSWEELDPESDQTEPDFDYETYTFMLEAFILKLMTYFNLFLQYLSADKLPPNTSNLFQQTIKTSCFWKLILLDFTKASPELPAINNSWDAEITNSCNLYDFLPASLQAKMRDYLETACIKTYKTQEVIDKGPVV